MAFRHANNIIKRIREIFRAKTATNPPNMRGGNEVIRSSWENIYLQADLRSIKCPSTLPIETL